MRRVVLCVAVCVVLAVVCGEAAVRVEDAAPESTEALIARLNPHGLPIRIDRDVDDACTRAPALPIGQQVMITVDTADGERHFALYIPTSYQPRPAADAGRGAAIRYPALPLHVLFHGLNDECARFMNVTQFLAQAEAEGFAVASACGLKGLLGVAWNAGTCCGFFNPDKPDDVGFARRVVQAVSSGVCIDASRVMATGFSNGGMLAEVLGCGAADVFGAVGSVGGVVEMRPGNAEGLRACDAAIRKTDDSNVTRPGVLLVHGDADVQVPWKGNRLLGFPAIESNLAGWVARNGCAGPARTTINTTGFVNTLFDGCDVSRDRRGERGLRVWDGSGAVGRRGAIVELVRARGGGHHWYESDEFSTGAYVRAFAHRVFDAEH